MPSARYPQLETLAGHLTARHPQRPASRRQSANPAVQLRKDRGTVNKMLKRQLYGHAGFDLLLARHFASRVTRPQIPRENELSCPPTRKPRVP